ncbi:MAG: hypothetical protein M3069_14550 [Chloroflexota bacterium]|nr:hypothetical protein [Chloroflexota bacterium]
MGELWGEDVAPVIDHVARVGVDDGNVAEAVDSQAWQTFRVAMEQAVGAQIAPGCELRPPPDRLSDKRRPGD